jgi:hypothetical protein
MKKTKSKTIAAVIRSQSVDDDEMLDDYSFLDWSKAERGKHAKRYAEGIRLVVISHEDDQNHLD